MNLFFFRGYRSSINPVRRNRPTRFYYAAGYCFAFVLLTFTAPAQDTIHYHLHTQTAVASQDYLPHWITANRYGVLDDQEYAVGLLRGEATLKHSFTQRFSLEAGLELIAKAPFVADQSARFWIQQGFVRARYGAFELTGGRWYRTLGTPDRELSTGSLAISGNARPIPQLSLSVPTYTSVPFTQGWVQVKGTYSHGWLGEDRHVRNALLHEKSAYVKVGGPFPVNLAAGLVHVVLWGGEGPTGNKLPTDLKNYWQVIRGKGADVGDPNDPAVIGEVVNAVGDNMGVYDLGIDITTQPLTAHVYQQTLFEDASGNNPFNGDRLLGLNVTTRRPDTWLSSIVYEFVHTKYQSGPSRPGGVNDGPGSKDRFGQPFGGRDNYYNNYLYRSGWTYQDRIIGTPLFYTQARTRLYLPDFVDPDAGFNFNIVNNRIVAHHVGVKGQVKKLSYRLLATFSTNYGTYGGINGGINRWGSVDDPDAPYAFRPPQHQHYFLLEVESHPFSDDWTLSTSVAVDAGEITDNVGVLIGLKRRGIITIP